MSRAFWQKLISQTRLKSLLLLFSLVITFVLVLAVFTETFFLQRELYQERQNTIRLLLVQATHLLVPHLKLKVRGEIVRIAQGLLQYEFIKGVRVVWAEPDIYRDLRQMDVLLGKKPSRLPPQLQVQVGHMQGHILKVPIMDGDRRLGTLQVAIDDATYASIIHRWWISMLVAGGVIIALVVGLVFFFFHTVARPIQDLARQMEASPGELRPFKPVAAPKEVQTLIVSYNHLVERLERYRRELEDALKRWQEAARQAEAASKAKTTFLANISHEIRTPMAATLGMTELLEDTSLSAEQRRYLADLKHAVETLQTMLNDILDFARLESGRALLHEQDFSLPQLLKECVALFQYQFAQKGLSFSWLLDPRLEVMVRGDKARVMQILINFLGNALKFTEKGSVTLEVSLDREEDDLLWVHFKVKDTGIGIAAEDLERIFVPFERAEERFDKPYRGTGLGLAISQHLARLMGGRIWCESKGLGQGATFHLFIPLKRLTGKPMPQEQTEAVSLKGKVLLAEDNEVSRRFLEKTLQKMGLDVVAVSDGKEAYARALSEGFDLYLLDLQMPYLDGLELTRRLRAAGIKRPILALTAHATEDFADKAKEAGMDGFITKPVSRRDLQRILIQWLQT